MLSNSLCYLKELGLVLSLLWREMPPQSSGLFGSSGDGPSVGKKIKLGIADYAGNSTTRKAKKPGPTKTTANNTMSRIEMKATTNPKDSRG
ncbi:hypothetical protein ACSBR2_026965 [Camellia fascicularis]